MPADFLEEDPRKIRAEILNKGGIGFRSVVSESWWASEFLKQMTEKMSVQNQAINYLIKLHIGQVQQGDVDVSDHAKPR